MTFVRDEIAEDVTNIEGKVAPHISRGGGNASSVVTAELEQAEDALAAQLQCWNEVFRRHFVPIDAARHCDAVLFAERLNPHTPGIVDVTDNHPDGATRRSGYAGFPEFGRQMLDKEDRYAIIGLPGVKDRIPQVG